MQVQPQQHYSQQVQHHSYLEQVQPPQHHIHQIQVQQELQHRCQQGLQQVIHKYQDQIQVLQVLQVLQQVIHSYRDLQVLGLR